MVMRQGTMYSSVLYCFVKNRMSKIKEFPIILYISITSILFQIIFSRKYMALLYFP